MNQEIYNGLSCEVSDKVSLDFAKELFENIIGAEVFFDVVGSGYTYHEGVLVKDLGMTVIIRTKNGYSNRRKDEVFIKNISNDA